MDACNTSVGSKLRAPSKACTSRSYVQLTRPLQIARVRVMMQSSAHACCMQPPGQRRFWPARRWHFIYTMAASACRFFGGLAGMRKQGKPMLRHHAQSSALPHMTTPHATPQHNNATDLCSSKEIYSTNKSDSHQFPMHWL